MSRGNKDDERELQELLRLSAGVVFSGAFVLIVVVALAMPFLTERSPDTTLLLGLATSALTAAAAMFGVQVLLSRNHER